jgi:hypothetical protein
VGRTCGEGLEVTLGGAHPQNGGDNEEVGGQDEHNGGDDIRSEEEIHQSLVALFPSTGQFYQGNQSQKKSSMTLSLQKSKVEVFLVMMEELIKPPRYEAATKNTHNFKGMA